MTTIILFAPLLGALLCGFGYKWFGEKGATYIATGLLFVAAFFSWIVFLTFGGETAHVPLFRWIVSGTLAADWGIRLDRLTAIMLIVVTTVSSLVHLYSVGYMAHDENWKNSESYRPRFFAYLSFFTFAMLMLVTADNLLQLFFGWEGVGVASYLLIGFYYRKSSANAAAIKAFVVNRVGDFGFLMGIFLTYVAVDSIAFDDIFAAGPGLAQSTLHFLWRDWTASEVIATMLFIGAMGKSAQLFLHTWLPDAMEGPTPVSALIHAATMVTAGVFLVCRMSPIIEYAPHAKTFIVYIGATTAFFAATVGLVQNDIKRVIAYSTCSQLGYMFVAAGVGVYSAAMFHLLTHAFFKALLFLCAGSVIHAMHHEQDMRNYGGLRKKVPITFWTMVLGTLAITGVGIPQTTIGFAGFLSKDAILESAWAGGTAASSYAFWMLVIAAAFTSFYSWRLIFMTFFGEPRGDHHAHDHAHESPRVMTIPLMVLALGAVFSGMIWYNSFFGDHARVLSFFGMPAHEAEAVLSEGEGGHAAPMQAAGEHAAPAEGEAAPTAEAPGAAAVVAHGAAEGPIGAIYMAPDNHVLEEAHQAPFLIKSSPFIAMLIGFGVAYMFYISNTTLPRRLAEAQRPLYLFLLNKWYFDELYDFLFVRPAMWLGRFLWKKGDGETIDGTINGVAMGFVPFVTRLAGRAQSGYLFHYAFAMVLGLVVLLAWISLTSVG
ncbi:NADH-quinone oxidoreductase subunit L [Amaricoccus solimangrovi]|uniref:NADH-quinone oxidoreductase subunit L n=1 Tax=Amaricoccus solimangrovi TaxID=2589815 RepID=A0A501WYL8_9RHOB|nr:NADH-quinone oxidoreductase subunit L [Amaricoccus solimangrovi]TPE53882.1 NADH-quinone oxidoreductase subunit L [Amaricoccus solimangrovi]